MSKEFKDRLARGELTNTKDYRRMKESLRDAKKEAVVEKTTDSQDWKSWDLSPVWSHTDSKKIKPANESIRADSVQRALDTLDKNGV